MPNVADRTEDGMNVYNYICEGCGSEGELKVPVDQRKPFGCPEGCGALYVQWTPPAGIPALNCVVCPVFEEGEPEGNSNAKNTDR